ncbi:SGNH/GDSL hydrolase family protein [Ralstonia sp. R-29]|uniref:SGNH/GDSL hydrolase family protein n=1 Tax=Ralstonia sp. R-29 TaxID=3404059 RepID=UPI003CF74E87
MAQRKWVSVASVVLALGLAACGGGGDEGVEPVAPEVPNVQRVVVFGDSLSDSGTWAPVAHMVGGGKATTNPGPVWAEAVAMQLGVALTPAVEADATGAIQACPKPGCFNYAQSGARVTDIGGALPYPVEQQLANFYAASDHTFNGNSDVVFVLAGSNDVFYWANMANTPGSGVTPEVAMAQVQRVASELVGYVNDMISKNATQLYVLNLPDSSLTPAGSAADAPLVNAFNATLQSGLMGTTARVIDFNTQFADVIYNGAQFGFVNTNMPACDPAKIDALVPGAGGSTLFCTADTLVAPGADQTYLFADGVHPTTGGHRLIASNVLQRLRADGVTH